MLELNSNTSNNNLCMKNYHIVTSQPYHKFNTHIEFIGVPENARSVGLVTPEVQWASSSASIPTAGTSYTPTPIIVNVTSISRSCRIRQSAVGT